MKKHSKIDFDVPLRKGVEGGCGVLMDYFEEEEVKWIDGSINFRICPIQSKLDLDELRKKIYYFLNDVADHE